MKKLAIIAGILICSLAALLAVLIFKGNTGGAGVMDVLKGEAGKAAQQSEVEREAHYDGELLCTKGFETITYTDRDFQVEFANPFYEEAPGTQVNVVFYDEKHGFLMRCIGQGTNSEFFECYRTDDGSGTWNRCAQDLWFEVDAENIVEMISQKGLVYMKTSPDLILGGNVTEITFSPDGGDNWYNYIDENIDEMHLQIRGMIEELTLEERISRILVPAIEDLADEDEPDMTIADMVEEEMPGGVLWCDAAEMGTWSFENQMRQAQNFMLDEEAVPLVIVASYAARSGTESEEETELVSDEDAEEAADGKEEEEETEETEAEPVSDTYYATFESAPSASIEEWESGLTVYTDGTPDEGFGIFGAAEGEGSVLKAALAQTPEDAVNAIKQGVQVLIVPDGFEETRDAIFDAVEQKTLTETQINQALYQVLYAKLTYLQNSEEE